MPRVTGGAEQTVHVAAGRVTLEGTLTIPPDARGAVLFAHGSGSSRHSPRNRFVAEALREGGLATLLVDLLTEDEERAALSFRNLPRVAVKPAADVGVADLVGAASVAVSNSALDALTARARGRSDDGDEATGKSEPRSS